MSETDFLEYMSLQTLTNQLSQTLKITKKPFVVLMTGPRRNGKDTAAKGLIELLDFHRLAFADPLKQEVLNAYPGQTWEIFSDELKEIRSSDLKLFNCIDKEFVKIALSAISGLRNESISEETELSPREIAQVWGTEYRRKFQDDYWVDQIRKSINKGVSPNGLYVITDCRFPNELVLQDEFDSILLRVQRPGFEVKDSHPSERALDHIKFNHVLINDSSIESLYKKVFSTLLIKIRSMN